MMTTAKQQAVPVITIDGPSGSGKGTIARALAAKLNWNLLDSGALYRLTALAAEEQGVAFDQPDKLAEVAKNLAVKFLSTDTGEERILLAGQEVTDLVRHETTGAKASDVARYPAVRDALLARQQAFCCEPGLVADGRDMGTVVFTDAVLKLFLTASAEARAQRRAKQLQELGLTANIRELLHEIQARDEQDANRAVAPLKPATDAVVIDSTEQSIASVLDTISLLIAERGLHV